MTVLLTQYFLFWNAGIVQSYKLLIMSYLFYRTYVFSVPLAFLWCSTGVL